MIIMKRLITGLSVTALLVLSYHLFIDHTSLDHEIHGLITSDNERNEERPEEDMSVAEKLINKKRYERMLDANPGRTQDNEAARIEELSTYANGQLSGQWDQVRFIAPNKQSYGFRVDGSVYDQANDVLYAISYAGHIWKIHRSGYNYTDTRWELMNHQYNFKTSYIEGFAAIDGTFRMVRSSGAGMQYSSDEGRTWINASGVAFSEKTFEGAVSKKAVGNRVFIVGQTPTGSTKVYYSDDDGVSYTALPLVFSPGSHKIKIFKAYSSESVFLVALNNSTAKIDLFECGVDDTEFELINSPATFFNGLTRVFGTYHNGQYHFYIGAGKTHIYYSDDKGATWQTKNSNNSGDGDIAPRTVHPTKPNIIFRGFLDVNMSSNNGASFSNFSHIMGWDVQHMRMYQRNDGSYFHFIGLDFGCYISDTPDVKSSYVQLNNSSPTQMIYDADHGQNYTSSFTGTQDRGTMGYINSSNESLTTDVRTTDGLRVTLGNNEESVWTWMYFGTLYHKSNFAARNSALVSLDWTSNWWASPMISSPNKKEDAVYIAAGERLKKFTYNPYSQQIIQTEHYFDFGSKSGSKISGLGYSSINPDLWYVSVQSGDFYYSIDGGQTFKKSSFHRDFPKANDLTYNYAKNQHVIRASNIDPQRVYYAGVGNAFMISNDGGKTFTNHNTGLNIYRIRDYDITPDEKFIFAGCGYGGLWVYSVDDDRWYEINDGAVPYVDFTDVEFIIKENTVNFSSYGSGVLRFKIDSPAPIIQYPDDLVAQVTSDRLRRMTWKDQSDNEEGFIIERSVNGMFTKIAELPANQLLYTDNSTLDPDNYIYRVKAYNSTHESLYSNYALVELKPESDISKENWKLISVSSQQTNGYPATNAFDNDPSTMWHTQWGVNPIPGHPHSLVIDMKETLELVGFSYLPRQDNQWNGTIKDYQFFISLDRLSWEMVATGSWEKTNAKKEVYFENKKTARYLKLISISEVNGSNFASCAELSVLDKISEPSVPNTPQFVQAGRISKTEIELVWMDLSDDETGFEIEQSTGSNSTKIEIRDKDKTSFLVKNTSPLLSYTFRIAAINDLGVSAYSQPITLKFIEGDGILSTETQSLNKSTSIYPNPFTDELNIKFSNRLSPADWQILTLDGKTIMRGSFSADDDSEKINTHLLISGTYVFQIGTKSDLESQIIIKE